MELPRLVNDLISDDAVCGRAPAILGQVNISFDPVIPNIDDKISNCQQMAGPPLPHSV